MEGALTSTVEGQKIEIAPGARCFVPRGAVHHFVNQGTETTLTLSILSPALIEPAYFRDMAALLENGQPDPAEVMRRHGLVVAPQKL